MKYFIDVEFLEGTQHKIFLGINVGKTKPTIDLISIGIVSEEVKYAGGIDPISKDEKVQVSQYSVSREYYAISKDFNLKEAWNRYDWKQKKINDGIPGAYKDYWIRNNVLKPIFIELRAKEIEEYNIAQIRNVVLDFPEYSFCFREFKRLINKYGKSNEQIAEELKDFAGNPPGIFNQITLDENKFYGYYCDYNWVVLCWLFGRMIDLPKGFPMYCIDLKQMLDEKVINKKNEWGCNAIGFDMLNHVKTLPNYPKQTNEHNALADARWNYELYKFLNNL